MDEQHAVDRLIELTNGVADEDVARSVLASVDWDVQRAADLLFGHPQPPSAPPPTTSMQPFDIDDTPVRPRQPVARPLWTWLTIPFQLLTGILRFIFGVLRIPLPRFATLTFYLPLSRARRGASSSPKGPEAWLRQLEDETGAISVGRIRPRTSASASGVASTSLTSRTRPSTDEDPDTDGRKRLPDFMLSSYEDFLRACQRDCRIGCVILVSAEHDDVPEFKRSTLTDAALIKAFQDNNILVWGGDVRDREAWSASEKLQATTYPFVAFIGLQPSRASRNPSRPSLLFPNADSTSGSNSSLSEPVLTVLSRHQGPAVLSPYHAPPQPSSLSSSPSPSPSPSPTQSPTPTSARTLLTHLTQTLLPRVSPYLTSHLTALTSHQRALERTRQLRAEQDAAFALSAARDRERIERRVQEEREARERVEREARERRDREEKEMEERRERERRERERAMWRTWARGAVVRPLQEQQQQSAAKPGAPGSSLLRIAVRLPTGARIVHSFDLSSSSSSSQPTLTSLFALIDAAFIPASSKPTDDPTTPPHLPKSPLRKSNSPTPVAILDAHILSLLNTSPPKTAETAYWSFRLFTAYPRAPLPWAPDTPLVDVPLLYNPSDRKATATGSQLVVELVESEGEGGGSARRRSGESSRRSGELGRKSLENGNGAGRKSLEGNGNGLSRQSLDGPGAGALGGAKGKGKEGEDHDGAAAENSDDAYETESSDEES